MSSQTGDVPVGYSYPATVAWFIAGGVVTAVFSGSLYFLTKNTSLTEVLLVGMLVPSFTWVVQMSAATLGLPAAQQKIYLGDLGRICLYGSFALLPAAIVNLSLTNPPWWVSAANVLASVALMGAILFRLTARHGIAVGWPISWCLTISVNMCLFLWFSSNWW